MATNPVKIIPSLQNCSIISPAQSVDGRYYLDPSHMTVVLKADTGYVFESDGTLSYQTEYSDDPIPLPIKATKTDTATVTLPSDISWDDQFSFPLTMSAVKATPTPTTTPTTTPTPTTTVTTTPTPTTTVTTQLDTLKNSLRIPSDLTDDDKLLQSYLDGATEYLRSTLGSDEDVLTKLNSKRAQVVINALAELMYENRGSDKVAKGFPYTLQVLINQLRFT